MEPVSRRDLLAAATVGTVASAAAAASAQTFGNPDQPPQGAINTLGNPASTTIPGPHNPALSSQFPDALSPPPTDVGDMPMFWATFNNAPRRIQNGGWARQVTQADFQIAEEISGVDMRLAPGAIRELHWHQAAEWGFVTAGAVRHHLRYVGARQCRRRRQRRNLVFPVRLAAFTTGDQRGWLSVPVGFR